MRQGRRLAAPAPRPPLPPCGRRAHYYGACPSHRGHQHREPRADASGRSRKHVGEGTAGAGELKPTECQGAKGQPEATVAGNPCPS